MAIAVETNLGWWGDGQLDFTGGVEHKLGYTTVRIPRGVTPPPYSTGGRVSCLMSAPCNYNLHSWV